MRTIVFGSGMNEKTDIKMEAYDLRERYTSTKTLLGNFFAILFELDSAAELLDSKTFIFINVFNATCLLGCHGLK